MRDMDSGTKSQLRRFYNAVRRACRTPEGDRQHEFVMLRARLAYTIARHSLALGWSPKHRFATEAAQTWNEFKGE